jgi:uracil-DNA glycosylase
MAIDIPDGWQQVVEEEGDTLRVIKEQIDNEESMGFHVYPPRENIFEAFKYFNPEQMSVCIIGQDCYHNPGEANGLAFSVENTQN